MGRIHEADFFGITTYSKPKINEVGSYLRGRLRPQNGEASALPARSVDPLGNAVYTSRTHKEAIMDGMHPATMIVSPLGSLVMRENSDLIRNIASGSGPFEDLGGGEEARVYKYPIVKGEVPSYVVVRYNYPVEGETAAFTSGIDQMRLLQVAKRDDPVPGLQYITPLFGTLDVMTSVYEAGHVPFSHLEIIMRNQPRLESSTLLTADEKVKTAEMLEKIDPNQPAFLTVVIQAAIAKKITDGMREWFVSMLDRGEIPFASPQLRVREVGGEYNLLLSIPKLYQAYHQASQEGVKLHYMNQDLLTLIRPACVLVEVSAGVVEEGHPVKARTPFEPDPNGAHRTKRDPSSHYQRVMFIE